MQARVSSLFQHVLPISEEPPDSKKKKRKRRKKSPAADSKDTHHVPIENPMKFTIQKNKKKRKQHIPTALREQVWIKQMGKVFHGKCPTTWCQNTITVFDFQSGHDIPESKGGPTTLQNLIPLCSRCNNSMGNQYTFKEWCALSPETVKHLPIQTVAEVSTSRCLCF